MTPPGSRFEAGSIELSTKIGLDDFFIFAVHFGVVDGELNFADEFDLNGDFRIDFDDFFIFTDNFGRTIANFDQISGDDD